MTRPLAAQEASHAARLEAAYAKATAHLTDQNIADQIAAFSERRAQSGYFIATSSENERTDAELFDNLRIELARRQAAAATQHEAA